MRAERRTLIPFAFRDISAWPAPALETMNDSAKAIFLRRRRAIEMYSGGCEYEEILIETGCHRPEVRRLIDRCLAPAADGGIFGWFGIVMGLRVKKYERKMHVNHERGGGPGGCAGALEQLFSKFPELRDLIEGLFFGAAPNGCMPEARVRMIDLHSRFKSELRAAGFTEADWPFNTDNCGYVSLCRYCAGLERGERGRGVLARGGREAQNRQPVGNGHKSLFVPLRPYTCVQLDFHKVDSASVFSLTNDYGAVFTIPLARWHFGLMIEEVSGACLGYCVALELTPSGDSVLETVQSAMLGAVSGVVKMEGNNACLIHEVVPQLKHQGCSVLKMDNAWSNASTEVVNNIISVIGCAVNFGPVRAWWRRSLIERIFRSLTELGLQRMPSTFGTGPSDTRRDRPQDAATKFQISVQDLEEVFRSCIRKHNLEAGERGQWMAPDERLRLSLSLPNSGLFPVSLPKAQQDNCRLLMHREEVTVRGNAKANIRPYFILGRHRHTNIKLANSFWLIGKQLVASVNRRLAREVYSTVVDSGEELGLMIPAGPWGTSNCSWRDRVLLQRAGMAGKYRSAAADPLESFREDSREVLVGLPAGAKKRASRAALALAKMDRSSPKGESKVADIATTVRPLADGQDSTVTVDPSTLTAAPAKSANDPFGLAAIPNLRATWSNE